MSEKPVTEKPVSGLVVSGKKLWQSVQRSRPFRTFSHFTDAGGPVLAGGMSYQALFAVFAGVFVGFGVFGIVLQSRPELLNSVVQQINAFVPGLLGDGDSDDSAVAVDSLFKNRGLSWTSVAASASLIWVAVNWFTGTRRSIRLIFGMEVKEYRNAVLLKVRDFVLALGFSVAILLSAALTVLSSNLTTMLLSWLGADPNGWFFGGLGLLVRYGAMYVFDVLVIIAIHRFLAEVRVGRWRLIAGSMLGGAALFGLKLLGTSLLGGASTNPLLQTFVIFVGLLLWFNFICRALLLTSSWIATGADPTLGQPDNGQPDNGQPHGGVAHGGVK